MENSSLLHKEVYVYIVYGRVLHDIEKKSKKCMWDTHVNRDIKRDCLLRKGSHVGE